MRLDDNEMLKTFNCGIGMIVFTPDCIVPGEFIEIGEIFSTTDNVMSNSFRFRFTFQ